MAEDAGDENDPGVGQAREHKCSVCNKTYPKRSKLEEHLRTHTGEKPFSCPDCDKPFTRKADMVAHRRTHNKQREKPYSCPECKNTFDTPGKLEDHRRTHTGEKPFKCPICDKPFAKKGTMERHRLTHNSQREKPTHDSQRKKPTHNSQSVKPFSCPDCQLGFYNQVDLKTHQAIVHWAEMPIPDPEEGIPQGRRRKRSSSPTKAPARKRLRIPARDTNNHLDAAPKWQDLGLPPLDPTSSDNSNIKRLYDLVERGLTVKGEGEDARYTPVDNSLQHVRTLPPHDSANREYRLDEDGVRLYDHQSSDGQVYRAWRLRARNLSQPNEPEVDIFTIHDTIPHPSDKMHLAMELMMDGKLKEKQILDRLEAEKGVQDISPLVLKNCCDELRHLLDMVKLKSGQGINLIDDTICGEDDRHLVLELGRIAVDIMNRAPFALDVHKWARQWSQFPLQKRSLKQRRDLFIRVSRSRTFIIVASLLEWKQKHHHSFDMDSVHGGLSPHAFELSTRSPVVLTRESQLRHEVPAGIWLLDSGQPDIENKTRLPVYLSLEDLDKDKVDARALDDGYGFQPWSFEESKDTKAQIGLKVMRIAFTELAGMVGSPSGVLQAFSAITKSFSTRHSRSIKTSPVSTYVKRDGRYNGGTLWAAPAYYPSGGEEYPRLSLTKKAMKGLDLSSLVGPDGTFYDSNLRSFVIPSTDRATLAYVYQQSLDALAALSSKNMLAVMVPALQCLDDISLGRIDRPHVVANYCSCPNLKKQRTTEHYCMKCLRVDKCVDLTWKECEDGNELLCRLCYDDPIQTGRAAYDAVLGKLRKAVEGAYRSDSRAHAPGEVPFVMNELEQYLIENFMIEEDGQLKWKDGYTGKLVDPNDTKFKTVDAFLKANARRIGHPRAFSIEKVAQRCLTDSDNLALHYPSNTILTEWALNNFKGVSAVSMLPKGKQCIQLRREVQDLPPCRGYHDAVAERREVLDRALDNQAMIDAYVPAFSRSRLDASIEYSDLNTEMEDGASGVWSLRLLPSNLRSLFATRGQIETSVARKEDGTPKFTMDDENWDWQVIVNCVDQIEGNTDPENGFNKHNMELPRLGPHEIPWPFREDTCPEDVDEEFIFNEFRARLKTWDEQCDSHHITHESPATLFIEYIVQWFETGGKCHWLGCIMTPYCGHPSNFSFGRGLMQKVRDGPDVPIEAGDEMKTGCKVLLPYNMFTDYDITRRTSIAETWKANRTRFHHIDEKEAPLMTTLDQAVLDLQDTCEHYGPLKATLDGYTNVPLPRSYKDRIAWLNEVRALCGKPTEDAETSPEASAPQADEVFDEELAFYEHGDLELDEGIAGQFSEDEEDEEDEQEDEEEARQEGDSDAEVEDDEEDEDDEEEEDDDEEEDEGSIERGTLAPSAGTTFGRPPVLGPSTGNRLSTGHARNQNTGSLICRQCGQPGRGSNIIMCTTPGHEDRHMHFHCAGFSAMPEIDDYLGSCSECRNSPLSTHGVPANVPNLRNLGASCYMSSSAMLLYFLDPIRELIMKKDGLLARPDRQSGRTARHWLPSSCKVNKTTSDEEIDRMSAGHMNNIKYLFAAFGDLFQLMREGKGRISGPDSRKFLFRLQDLNKKEFSVFDQNDSAQLLSDILDALIFITDNSTPGAQQKPSSKHQALVKRQLVCQMPFSHDKDLQNTFIDRVQVPCCGRQYCRKCVDKWLENGLDTCPDCERRFAADQVTTVEDLSPSQKDAALQLPDFAQESLASQVHKMNEGRWSAVFQDIYVQVASEKQCAQPGCGIIDRNFHYEPQLELRLPESDKCSVDDMLKAWHLETRSSDDAAACVSGIKAHAGSTVLYQKITRAPRFLYIRFPRFNRAVLQAVEVPEYIDLFPYADGASLPSDDGQPRQCNVKPIYKLKAVNMYLPPHSRASGDINGGHFVLYVLHEGKWIVLDDIAGDFAKFEHPQRGIDRNAGIAYYVVYEQTELETKPQNGEVLRPKYEHEDAASGPPTGGGTDDEDMLTCTEDGCLEKFASDADLLQHVASHHTALGGPDKAAEGRARTAEERERASKEAAQAAKEEERASKEAAQAAKEAARAAKEEEQAAKERVRAANERVRLALAKELAINRKSIAAMQGLVAELSTEIEQLQQRNSEIEAELSEY